MAECRVQQAAHQATRAAANAQVSGKGGVREAGQGKGGAGYADEWTRWTGN